MEPMCFLRLSDMKNYDAKGILILLLLKLNINRPIRKRCIRQQQNDELPSACMHTLCIYYFFHTWKRIIISVVPVCFTNKLVNSHEVV